MYSATLLRSYGGGNGNPLQYSCLENPIDRGAGQGEVHGIAESDMTVQLTFTFLSIKLIKKFKTNNLLI